MSNDNAAQFDILSSAHERARRLHEKLKRHEAELTALPGPDPVVEEGLAAIRRVMASAKRIVKETESRSPGGHFPPPSSDFHAEDFRDG